MTALDAARALLVEFTGREPDGIWSAPGRVNLIGEHTDYNDGFVLPFAIEQRTYAAVVRNGTGELRVRSTFADDLVVARVDDLDALFPTPPGSTPGVPEWSAYVLGVAWALRALRPEVEALGLDIAIASEVPVGAGLSSSAAIEGVVAAALNDLWKLGLDAVALAQAGRRAENDAVGAPTGVMDQMASMLGRADAATFLDCRSLEHRSVPTGFAAAGLEVLVIDTRVQHAHSTGGYRERHAACELGARSLGVASLRDLTVHDLPRAAQLLDADVFRRVRHVVTENQRVLDTVAALTEQGPRAIGELLTASHSSMRDDFEISVPELDTAVDTARAAGALGARMTGGGFGGSAIALVSRDDAPAVTVSVRARFAAAGFRPPTVFPASPSVGPRRDC
ncbi:galactokinase [Gordonia alkaliphila]|uniref:galactokinase n=1 Tax=Gordonia alkaliphila TaxID=1053547 RepID=UPI001FF6C34B|nr:galactokinase [Gordonia alkaliphila]MCK0438951.1 galactokinase [Gordonia alkaliphila]